MTNSMISMANDLVDLNDRFHVKAEELFCGGEAGIDEYESHERSWNYFESEIKSFEAKYGVHISWDNNYTFNLYITDSAI